MRVRDSFRPRSDGRCEAGRPARAARLAAACAVLLAAGCASAGPSGSGPALPPPAGVRTGGTPADSAGCPPEPERAALPERLRVAAPGSVAPGDVPSPRSEAERIAFRQMYGTLVRVDCDGRLRPGLAESWDEGEGGHRWTFHLRVARFWDGSRVTAGDVAWSWRRLRESRRPVPGGVGVGVGGPTLVDVPPALPDSVVAVDDGTLAAYFEEVAPPAAAFSDLRLAVLRAGGGRWPLGTGPLRPAATDSGDLVLEPAFGSGSTVRLVSEPGRPGGDERDLLDAGVDIVVTSDPGTRRYAETLPTYAVLPVPWSRTYAVAVPRAAAGPGPAPAGRLEGLRASLARDAMREEAVSAPPLAWRTAPACAVAAPPSADASGPGRSAVGRIPRLAYALGDGAARELADRLVALASVAPASDAESAAAAELMGVRPGLDWRTLPLVAEVLGASARAGEETAYVVALPRRVLDPCAARRSLEKALPWLDEGGALTPLVDTRPAVLVRRDVSGLTLDFEGTPRLGRAGRPDGGGGGS